MLAPSISMQGRIEEVRFPSFYDTPRQLASLSRVWLLQERQASAPIEEAPAKQAEVSKEQIKLPLPAGLTLRKSWLHA